MRRRDGPDDQPPHAAAGAAAPHGGCGGADSQAGRGRVLRPGPDPFAVGADRNTQGERRDRPGGSRRDRRRTDQPTAGLQRPAAWGGLMATPRKTSTPRRTAAKSSERSTTAKPSRPSQNGKAAPRPLRAVALGAAKELSDLI